MEVIDLNTIKNNINPENTRIKLAKQMTNMIEKTVFYEGNSILGILLGGSVSRGLDDEYSDIELLLFLKDVPTIEERIHIVATLLYDKVKILDYDENEDGISVNGTTVNLKYYTEADLEILKSVIDANIVDYSAFKLINTIDNGIILKGEKFLKSIKNSIKSYPKDLAVNLIIDNVYHLHYGNLDAFSKRDNPTEFYSIVVNLQKKIFNILSGINRNYIGGYKWMYHELSTMKYKPQDIEKRFKDMFNLDSKDVISELEDILTKTLNLANEIYTDLNLDVGEIMKKYSYKRKI